MQTRSEESGLNWNIKEGWELLICAGREEAKKLRELAPESLHRIVYRTILHFL